MNSLVTVTENQEIKKIGMSCINDLISDNWGKMLEALISGRQFVFPPAKDVSGNTNNALFVYNSVDQFNSTNTAGNVGSLIQVGKSLVPATRQDFKIGDPFVTLPESVFNGTGSGGWNSGLGQVQIPLQIVSGGSGAISETVLFGNWASVSPVENEVYLLSHDNISPVVNFIVGQTINVDYSMVFN